MKDILIENILERALLEVCISDFVGNRRVVQWMTADNDKAGLIVVPINRVAKDRAIVYNHREIVVCWTVNKIKLCPKNSCSNNLILLKKYTFGQQQYGSQQ
jgi:hypothetical protein